MVVIRFSVLRKEKRYKLPETPGPNVPYLHLRLYVEEYRREVEVEAAWSDNPNQLKQNAAAAIKSALNALIADEEHERYQYDSATDTLTKVA